MSAEVIEGEAREVTDLVPVEPAPVVRLAAQQTPEEMVSLATRMADALKDIVDRQRLFAVISGKKYPQVEAWMTIGRMDNVVAREAEAPIRHEDGSYEAFVELVRLGDGAVIGRASALCGTPDDKPWNGRAEPARRSMAVTRATSRAFRQQYSWIMALAGYEPTPVEEMPVEGREAPPAGSQPATRPVQPSGPAFIPPPSLVGPAEFTGKLGLGLTDSRDGQLHQTPDGAVMGFVLLMPNGKKVSECVALGPLAVDIAERCDGDLKVFQNRDVTVTGELWNVPWRDNTGQLMQHPYKRLVINGLVTPDFTVPEAA